MNQIRADLRSYYEEEARQGRRGPLKGRRVELRAECLAMLKHEQRNNIVDFGAGPGRDAPAFVDAGISYTGLDLAHGNAVLAAQSGITVVHGSIAEPPLRAGWFDAGWSMSTLMHVPEPEVPDVLTALSDTLAPGAPLFIGQWGGTLGDHIDDTMLEGERRLFSLRSFDQNLALVERIGAVERQEIWPIGPDGWEYHVFVVRIGEPLGSR